MITTPSHYNLQGKNNVFMCWIEKFNLEMANLKFQTTTFHHCVQKTWVLAKTKQGSSLHMLISRSIQMSSSRMSKPWNSWCPYDCLTPYPHYLTSISLLVTPQQIRKASQHLHGDRPQSSRWPQCAAWQLKRKRRAGKWKWVRIRGESHRQREHASVARVHITIHTYPHAQMHVHASVHHPCKNKTPRHAPAGREWKVALGNEPRCSWTPHLASNALGNPLPEWQTNPMAQSIRLTL